MEIMSEVFFFDADIYGSHRSFITPSHINVKLVEHISEKMNN